MKREESFDVPVTVPIAIDVIVHAFATVRGCTFHRVEPNGVVRGSTSFNLATYGEALAGWAVPLGPTTSRVTLLAEDSMPLQLFDWGRKRRMLEALRLAVCDGAAQAARMHPGVPPPPFIR